MTQRSRVENAIFKPQIAIKMEEFLRFMLEYNKMVNLTSITAWDEAVVKHLMDSLAIEQWNIWGSANNIVDLGTGPGIPGIPLAIAYPDKRLFLLETNGKKVKFLNEAIKELQLNNVTVLHGRAEELGQKKELREHMDLVVTRAVASLPVLLELAFPLVKVGGHLVAYKGPEPHDEIERAQSAQRIMFAKDPEIIYYSLDKNYGDRTLVIYGKTLNTPGKYPRRPGVPEKNPL